MIFPHRYKIFMRQDPTLESLLQRIKFLGLPNGKAECVIIIMKIHAVDPFFALYCGRIAADQQDNMNVPKFTVAFDRYFFFCAGLIFPFIANPVMYGFERYFFFCAGLIFPFVTDPVMYGAVTRGKGKRKA